MSLARRRLARKLLFALLVPTVVCVSAYALWTDLMWSQLLASGEPHEHIVREGTRRAAFGLLLLTLAVSAVVAVGVRVVTSLVGDLVEGAERKVEAAQAERRELARRIQQAQALTIVGQVAASMAHEIGSPLNTILGWARLAAAEAGVPAPLKERFELIAQQTERITRIVQRMLATARPQAHAREPVDVRAVCTEVLAFLAPDLRSRGIVASLDGDGELPRLVAVRDEVLQLVLNLAMNALQAQPRGGELRLTLSEAGTAERPALRLDVADRGPGVAPELREQVFEPFYSTKRAQGGHGLGLSIVADLVREMGGTVEVESAAGGGALFRVTLPAQRRP